MLFGTDSLCSAWAAWCGRFAGGLAVLETALSLIIRSWAPAAAFTLSLPLWAILITVGCTRIRYLARQEDR
jgi:hypothetical protein